MASTLSHEPQAGQAAAAQHEPASGRTAGAGHGALGSSSSADSPRQLKQGQRISQLQQAAAQSPTPSGGLPAQLRAGIEALSGLDMSGVRVHRNSSKPAALQAHAYAQGQDIHLGPGQEKHLPHEAWHVVQQRQGRVQPTLQRRGAPVNDDPTLEREADRMGTQAMQLKTSIQNTTQVLSYTVGVGKKKQALTDTVGRKMTASLDPDDARKGSAPGSSVGGIYGRLNVKYRDTNSFVKGHLLNANLGGLGVTENLFPITSEANRAHSTLVEEPVKEAFLTLENEITGAKIAKGSTLFYEVEAIPDNANNFLNKPSAALHCRAFVQDPAKAKLYNVLSRKRTITSTTGEGENEVRNESLKKKGWGSTGTGSRSGTMKVTRKDVNGDVTYEGLAKEWDGSKWISGAKVLMEVK